MRKLNRREKEFKRIAELCGVTLEYQVEAICPSGRYVSDAIGTDMQGMQVAFELDHSHRGSYLRDRELRDHNGTRVVHINGNSPEYARDPVGVFRRQVKKRLQRG
jgi:hypothetical protein